MPRVLHLLSQRPSYTGSGVMLEALVDQAAQAGWEQEVVVGTPADDPQPQVAGARVHPLVFGTDELPFPLPGMSDVMPYPSSRFSALTSGQLGSYRTAWRNHVGTVLAQFGPDVIHSHHVWILSSIVKDLAPDTPVVTQSHATGFRQMTLCPHLADEVRQGCCRNERIAVLTEHHAARAKDVLGLPDDRIVVTGAGYRDNVFHTRGRRPGTGHILYVGKYSRAKGLPWLLDAFERLGGDWTLHVAGAGAGEEADALRERMEARPRVVLHGQLAQPELADLMRQCELFVLPSFHEGLPLVVVEALACGCRALCSDLPAVAGLGETIDRVPLPRIQGADEPVAADLPRFVDDLARCLENRAPLAPAALAPFAWKAVFARVETVWQNLIRGA